MKILLTERQLKHLLEQSNIVREPDLKKLNLNLPYDYKKENNKYFFTSKNTENWQEIKDKPNIDFLEKSVFSKIPEKNVFNKINQLVNTEIKGNPNSATIKDIVISDTLYFVFPGKEQKSQLKYFKVKELGLITVILEKFQDLVDLVAKYNSLNKKVDKIIVGSHGSPGTLLYTEDENKNFYFKTDWLNDIKKLLKSPNSEVHFTACYGGDALSVLKDAASKLGVKAYGGKGIGYLGYGHQKGYYMCEPKPISKEHFNLYYKKLKDGYHYGGFDKKPSVNEQTFDWSSNSELKLGKGEGSSTHYTEPSYKEKLVFINNIGNYSDNFLIKYGYCKSVAQPSFIGNVIAAGHAIIQPFIDTYSTVKNYFITKKDK